MALFSFQSPYSRIRRLLDAHRQNSQQLSTTLMGMTQLEERRGNFEDALTRFREVEQRQQPPARFQPDGFRRPLTIPVPQFEPLPVPVPGSTTTQEEFAALPRQRPAQADISPGGGLFSELQRGAERFLDPSAAAGLQVVESPIGSAIPAVLPGKVLQTGLEAAGVPEGVSPFPRNRSFNEAFGGGVVNPVAAALGDDEEIAKAQAVLEEAGLPRALAAQVIFDPANLLPIIGFTKVDDVVRGVRAVLGATGRVRQTAITTLRKTETLEAVLRAQDTFLDVDTAAGSVRAAGDETTFGISREVPVTRGPVGDVRSLSDDELLGAFDNSFNELVLETKRAERAAGVEFPLAVPESRRLDFLRARANEINDETIRRGMTVPQRRGISEFTQGEEFTGLDVRLAGEETAETSAESVGNRFAAPLRDFDQVTSEVVTTDNPVIRNLTRGINPSVAENTAEGRILTAFARQRVAAEELRDVTVSAALDPHAQPFTTRTGGVFNIGADGGIKNLQVQEGQSRIWQDVFSRPSDYNLTSAQRSLVDDFRQVVDEVEALRVQAGLRPRAKTGSEGWGYVPRQTKTVRGVELRRPSSPGLQRVFEEAQEGVARGIRYDTNPRATLELHVGSAYREIAARQLDDALTPLSVKPTELVKAKNPQLVARTEAAAQELTEATRARRSLVVGRGLEAVDPQVARRLRGRVTDTRRAATKRVETARTAFQKVKEPYRRAVEAARRSEVAPGQLFGRTEDTIAIGQWRGRFFPREQADLLTEKLGTFLTPPETAGPLSRGVEILGNHIRFLSAVGDFAAPFIQGLPLLARNPVAWSRATLRHYQAWLDPTVQGRFIKDHIETFQEMAQHGIPIGDPEFFAALRKGQGISGGRLLEVLPKGKGIRSFFQQVGRQTFGRFQASYNMFLGSARAQMWEALKPTWRGSLDDLAAHIRNMTGGLDSRALGVGPTQRGFESVWMAFSPRLLRSTVALVGDLRLGLSNPKGLEAFRSLGQLVTGAVGVYVTAGLAQGKSWDEIQAGLNPLNGKRFLSFEINGDHIGIGGQVRAISQFLAATGSAIAPGGRPISDLISNDNPLLQFYQSRGAPALNIVGGVAEAVTGGQANVLPFENIDSLPDLIKHIGESALPFAVQGVLEGEGPFTTAAALIGARTSAQTPVEGRRALVLEITGKAEDDLDPGERFDLFEGDEQAASTRFGTNVNTIRQLRELQRKGREQAGERFGSPFEERRGAVSATAVGIETERLVPAAKALLRGDPLALDAYNEARSEFFTSRRAVSESESARLGIEPQDFEAETTQQKLVDDYYALEPKDTNRNGFIDKEDMEVFFDAQGRLLDRMNAGSKRAIKDPRNFFTDPNVIDIEEQRLEAVEALKAITTLPKWVGLSVEEGDKVDDLVTRIKAEVQRFKAKAVREPGRDPDLVTFRSVAEWMSEQGDITALNASNAIAISSGIAIRAQGRIDLALESRRVLLTIFPNFFDSVLPVDVERSELTEEEIGQLEPVRTR